MKNLFVIIVSVMLVACSSESELLIEQFHDEYFKGFGTKGPENRYGIDKHIYIYAAYDRQSIIDDYSGVPGCVIHVYNLEPSSPLLDIPVDMALTRLNQMDTPNGAKWLFESSVTSNYYFVGGGGRSIKSTWFKQGDLPTDFFNPFKVNLPEFYQDRNIEHSPVKTDLDECLQFFYDGGEKQTYTEKYHLDFLEKNREDVSVPYKRSDFEYLLKDKDNLVNLYSSSCDGSNILFLNNKAGLLFFVSSGRGKYPNPFCS